MSTNRRAGLPPSTKGPDGRHLCRWCRKPVDRPRLYWCSDACVEEYRIVSDPGYARQKVWERDEGVCALCGLDTVALEAEWRSLPYLEREDFLFERIGVRRSAHYSLWEADHIVPVVEGGGGTGLENLRTLCLRCHRAETAKLARRRALARKGQATIL